MRFSILSVLVVAAIVSSAAVPGVDEMSLLERQSVSLLRLEVFDYGYQD